MRGRRGCHHVATLNPMKRLALPFARAALAVLCAVALCSSAARAESAPPKKEFAIAADIATAMLKQFSAQSGEQLLYSVDAVAGEKLNPVAGTMTPREALERMAQGTDLVVMADQKNGALSLVKSPARKNVDSRRHKGSAAHVEDGTVTLQQVEVTGSRLALTSGEHPVQPVLTFSSLDIERMGAANLGQLFQYIPAITSYNTGLGTETVTGTNVSGNAAGQTGSRTTAQLRGGTETSTLLLVDGKRVPLTGLRNAGGNGYDLGGIPLSAIERVEVLLDGASAVYGADAVNGVINVILKKHYSGTEVRLSYDNTFDKDSAIRTASLTHGFANGKWSGLLTLSASDNTILLLQDRHLTRSFNRTVYGGLVDQSQPTLYVEGTGSLNVATGNLPGTTVPRVSIPSGYAGGAITVASYVAAPAPVAGVTPGRQSATNYAREKDLYFRLDYDWNDHLVLTGSVRFGRKTYRDNGQWRSVQNVTIPAGYAGNPFGTAVRLSKTFYDLPPLVNGSDTGSDEFSVTAAGKLVADWHYDASLSYMRGTNYMITPDLSGAGGQVGIAVAPATQFTSRLNAEIAAGRSPILIYDSNLASPNAPGALDPFWVSLTQTRLNDEVHTWTYSVQADGKVITLPAGDLKAVAGAERREEYVAFPNSLGGQVWGYLPQRNVNSFFAEARIPVVGGRHRFPLLYQLDFSLAARTEDYSDFGRATTPRYGTAWRPLSWILVRGSYGEGFLAPQLYRVAQSTGTVTLPASTVALIYAGQTDLSRGNAPITGSLDQLSGGNPNLKPQLSDNWTYGVVVDVPQVKGLSLSFDYYDNKYTRAFGSISSMMDRQRYAPATIFRGPKLPTDPSDWLGPIIGYDGRTINIANSRAVGYSFGARYQRRTAWGDLTVSTMGEKTLTREEQILPGAAYTASVNKRYVPMRVTSALFWSLHAWEAGATAVYGGRYWTDSNNTAIYPSRYTDAVTRWDFSGAYDFGRLTEFASESDPWWRRMLRDTKIRVALIDAFNTEPPLNVNGTFASSVIDTRLRRYVLDVTKRF